MRAMTGRRARRGAPADRCSPAAHTVGSPGDGTGPIAGHAGAVRVGDRVGDHARTVRHRPRSPATQGWRADIDALLESRERLHPDPWHDMPRATLGRGSGRGEGPDPGHDRRRGPGRGRAPGLDAGLGRPRRPHRDLPVHAGERHPRIPDPDVAVQRRPRDHRGARAVRRPRRLADRGESTAIPSRTSWPSSSRSRRATTRRTCSRTRRSTCARASCSPASASSDAAGPATFTVVGPGPGAPPRDVEIEPILADDDVAWHGGDPLTLRSDTPAVAAPQARRRCGGRTSPTRTRCTSSTTRSVAGSTRIADEILARAEGARCRPGRRRPAQQRRRRQHDVPAPARDPAGPGHRPARDACTLLIGRLTFSAAANFATELEQNTGATFAGEAMGGSPNLYGDARPTDLPYGGR